MQNIQEKAKLQKKSHICKIFKKNKSFLSKNCIIQKKAVILYAFLD